DEKRGPLVAAAKDLRQWIAELAATQEVDSTPVVRIRFFSLPEGEARSAFVKKHGLKESAAWVHPEGYSLRFHKKKGVWLVDVVGADDHGAYYGAESLGQLLVKTPEGLALRRAKVDDWPTYSLRAFKSQAFEGSMWAMKDAVRMADWAPHFKFNAFSPCYTHLADFKNPSREYLAFLDTLLTRARRNGTHRIIPEINVYYGNTIVISWPHEIRHVADLFGRSLRAGSREVMLQFDDFAKLSPQDKRTFGTLAKANVALVNDLLGYLRQDFPNVNLWVCPPVYFMPRDKEQERYLVEFGQGIDSTVSIVWTGKKVTTLEQHAEDIRAYQKLVNGHPLVYWDNTLKIPPGWSNVFRCNAYLGAVKNIDSTDWRNLYTFTNGRFVGNTYGPSEIYKIPLATMADYLWNPEAYDPERSFKMACARFDRTNPKLGSMVARFANELHQRVYDLRVKFCENPTVDGLAELRAAVAMLEHAYVQLTDETQNQLLLDQLRPYVNRHVLVLPYFESLLRAKREGPNAYYKELSTVVIPGLEAVRDHVVKKKGEGEHKEGVFRGALENKNIEDLKKLADKVARLRRA
ncbi:MAG: hypothetical protein GXO73_12575, partial [Calditrichaeota bacterium]|nr:hypothetical protein [Calditrichota bacterium]